MISIHLNNCPSSLDEEPMNKGQKWLQNSKKSEQEFEVWYRQRGGLGRCSSLLVYDTFEGHVTENVKVVFAKENSNLALIPNPWCSLSN